MRISVTEAKGQLTDLVRRAEAGDEVILTRHGQAAVRLCGRHEGTFGRQRAAQRYAGVRIRQSRSGTGCCEKPRFSL
jgi:prevent-host-death family protein